MDCNNSGDPIKIIIIIMIIIVKIKSHTLFWEKNPTHIHTCTLFPLKKRHQGILYALGVVQLVKALIVCSEKKAILSPEPINN